MVNKVDTSAVTINAFNKIKNKNDKKYDFLGQEDEKKRVANNFQSRVRVWTNQDKKSHKYFTELSLDMSVEDFLHTCELTCAYDSDLMEYWEIIRQTCVVYGTNKGKEKILFIGRVRELKQEGFSLKITLQSYAWKFKQTISQAYANDNVLNKDAYTILRLMFEALKIDSWVISPITKNRLKEVGINSDGNLTVNQEEITEMPDLIERLKESKPKEAINKYTLKNKLREHYVHNIKDINYTLKYEKPSKKMQKIASQGSYAPGSNIYEDPYASPNAGGAAAGGAYNSAAAASGGCNASMASVCPAVKSSSMQGALGVIYRFQRGCTNDYATAKSMIVNYAKQYSATCKSQVLPCLGSMAKYVSRPDKQNAASDVLNAALSALENPVQGAVRYLSSAANNFGRTVSGWGKSIVSGAQNLYNQGAREVGKFKKDPVGYISSHFSFG